MPQHYASPFMDWIFLLSANIPVHRSGLAFQGFFCCLPTSDQNSAFVSDFRCQSTPTGCRLFSLFVVYVRMLFSSMEMQKYFQEE